jgi:hypothetical protein
MRSLHNAFGASECHLVAQTATDILTHPQSHTGKVHQGFGSAEVELSFL